MQRGAEFIELATPIIGTGLIKVVDPDIHSMALNMFLETLGAEIKFLESDPNETEGKANWAHDVLQLKDTVRAFIRELESVDHNVEDAKALWYALENKANVLCGAATEESTKIAEVARRICSKNAISRHVRKLESHGKSFPFEAQEFKAIEWNNQFVQVFLISTIGGQSSALSERIVSMWSRERQSIRVGDYVKAKIELSLIKRELGLGIFSKAENHILPMGVFTVLAYRFKIGSMIHFCEKVDSSRYTNIHLLLRELSKILALCAMVSWRGRKTWNFEDVQIEALGDFFYEDAKSYFQYLAEDS